MYKKPIVVEHSSTFYGMQSGQWVSVDGSLGRFVGITSSGTVVIAWKGKGFAKLLHYVNNN